MKISDKELREHCRAFNNDAFPTNCVAELLQLRAEVRRLRKALNRIVSLPGRATMGDVDGIAVAALAPQRKKKGQKP